MGSYEKKNIKKSRSVSFRGSYDMKCYNKVVTEVANKI